MIEIKPEDLELMKVWDNEAFGKWNRYVFAKHGNKYLAIDSEHSSREEAIKALENGYIYTWPHAEPIKTKLTAVVKSAEEITGIEGMVSFSLRWQDKGFVFQRGMNEIAGKRIEIIPQEGVGYGYIGEGYAWRREWLKDFREEEE